MVDSSWCEKNFVGYDSVFLVVRIMRQDSGRITEERKQLHYRVNTELIVDTVKNAKVGSAIQFFYEQHHYLQCKWQNREKEGYHFGKQASLGGCTWGKRALERN